MSAPIARPTKYCHACASIIDAMAVVCPHCGVAQGSAVGIQRSTKPILPAFLLCLFFGVFGVHRFYVGKAGTGLLQLLTLGGFGIWALADLIIIIAGGFRDADGLRITEWT